MFTLKINTDNSAFHPFSDPMDQWEVHKPEVSRILREIAKTLDAGFSSGKARDVNGNYVGDWELK